MWQYEKSFFNCIWLTETEQLFKMASLEVDNKILFIASAILSKLQSYSNVRQTTCHIPKVEQKKKKFIELRSALLFLSWGRGNSIIPSNRIGNEIIRHSKAKSEEQGYWAKTLALIDESRSTFASKYDVYIASSMKNLRLNISLTGVIEAVQCPCTSWASSDVGRQSGSLAVSSTQLDLSLVCLEYHPAVGHRQVLFFLFFLYKEKIQFIFLKKRGREREMIGHPFSDEGKQFQLITCLLCFRLDYRISRLVEPTVTSLYAAQYPPVPHIYIFASFNCV